MATRILLLLALGAVVGAVAWWYQRRSAADAALGAAAGSNDGGDAPTWAPLASPVLDAGAACTWVIFTTPYCASCTAVERDLNAAFPHHAVRLVDATEEPDLAATYQVRRAPTTILADHAGAVLERLVGPEAVRRFIGATEDPALVE